MGVPSDIIVALATGVGRAALGIVRLSGDGSHRLALRLCPGLAQPPECRRLVRVRLVDPGDGRGLDDATAVFFAAGASFTGEESVEFTCHGGPLLLDRVVGACVQAGARHALAGEFTRRAVALGRLDLVQAEAVALLADASHDAAIDVALSALAGTQSQRIAGLCDVLLDLLADWEATLDFLEDDGVVVDRVAAARTLSQAIATMDQGLDQARALRPLVEGVQVVLVGAPNAGKSSLFNALLEQDRAIVRPEPGTTRDVVGERLPLGGVAVTLLDTAGLRAAEGVEAEGVARARDAMARADVRVLVVDGTDARREGDAAALDVRPDIVVRSKADLWAAGGGDGASRGTEGVVLPGEGDAPVTLACSVRDGRGIEALRVLLTERVAQVMRRGRASEPLVVGERQVAALAAARVRAQSALRALADGTPLDLATTDLRAALAHLGEISGATVTEAVMDRVFRRFCVGK